MTFLQGEAEPLKDASRAPADALIETRLHTGRLFSRVTEATKPTVAKEVDAD